MEPQGPEYLENALDFTRRNSAWQEGFREFVLHKLGSIETRKYRREELVCQAPSPDFQKAMIHTTIVGLEEDELRVHGTAAAE